MLKTAPRLSRVARTDAPAPVSEIYDRYMRTRGNVPNMFRTMAHRPEILATMIAHFEAVLNTGTLPVKLKELVIVRTSQINRCEYCLASHSQIALKLGWSKEQIEDLENYESRSDFTPAEKTALSLAEQMTLDSNHISDEFMERLRSFYDEGEVVELMASIGIFNYFNRFNNALQMEPTKPGQGA
ncbi:putative peroxidase-related enzyme [Silvibacterium bohemicum]|uniref:Putative peroxidase-related enzyme n=1 Tax=Silvibacterium bohemicum TaxID=1577686 RepID=A0A841K2J9_9BACT|nr:carboxymuconolactone decarboxylase family protein [Silvibacterium bohemicum]MBB6144868.1 putative peroxidase-related enzyme [Silvibacterium bohemicum]